MEVVAFCTLPAREIIADALNVSPVTSPPVTVQTFEPEMLQADIIYIRLHGLPMIPTRWFGEDEQGNLIAAMGIEQIEAMRLPPGSTVIIANCYGTESPMTKEFYDAGAKAVIAGSGPNYASTEKIVGADLLATRIIDNLLAGHSAYEALVMAKAKMLITAFRESDRDTLEFQIVERPK
jgi:hypothetical protein